MALIEALIESGHAYESDGDVYFASAASTATASSPTAIPTRWTRARRRAAASCKADRLDFALWKARKEGEDTAWPSPWGEGRPGWHIECSAMAEKLLGLDFAIHGGGSDLVFPHHENEIAQTEAARGRPLARDLDAQRDGPLDEEKMSKSVGNIFQLSEAIDRFGAEAVLGFLVAGHYRQPIAFSRRGARGGAGEQSSASATTSAPSSPPGRARATPTRRSPSAARRSSTRSPTTSTPRGRWPRVFDLIAEGNRRPLAGAHEALAELLDLLGLEALAARRRGRRRRRRAAARRARDAPAPTRDFERADRIRDELAALGWTVRDTPDGARLVRSG